VRMAPVPTATVTLDPREGHFGVTLSNSKVAYGCKIDDANPRDLVYLAGLRPGMVITKINDESVSSHDDLLQVMEQSRALMKKIKITYLTEKDAVIQGKRETASICKFLFILLLVFCSFFGAVYTGVIEPKKIYKSFMPPPPPPDPNAPKTGMAGEIASLREQFENALTPEQKERIKKMYSDDDDDEEGEEEEEEETSAGGAAAASEKK